MSKSDSTKIFVFGREVLVAPCPNPNLKGPCHIWTGSKTARYYGGIYIKGKMVLLHRRLWEAKIGKIPKGLLIDHQCQVKLCCNLDHLRLVTHKINTTENSTSVGALNKVKTKCPQGHEYTSINTYITRSGSRRCRTCKREKGRAKVRKPNHNASKTHCKHGHPFDKANTYIGKNGSRHCRTCHRNEMRVRK